MKLTIEDNPEAIKRFGHVKPAPRRGAVPCSVACPGTVRLCSLRRGHAGPHVSHGRFGRVLAVWDKGLDGRALVKQPRKNVRKVPRKDLRKRKGVVAALVAFLRRFLGNPHFIETAFLLVLALAMVGFAIDWALRIIGLR